MAIINLSTAQTGDPTQVQTAITNASTGDVINLANGSYSWASGISIAKAITVQAATITPSIKYIAPPTVSPPCVTTTPAVTINDNLNGGTLVNITSQAGGSVFFGGVNFALGTATTGNYITTQGSGQPIVIYDCAFRQNDNVMTNNINWTALGGLVYNCWFNGGNGPCGIGNSGVQSGAFIVKPAGPPWYNVSTFGAIDTNGTQNLYIEQCQFDNFVTQGVDVDDFGRVVIRYSLINNCNFLTHGITSNWGGRQLDFNNNQFQYFWGGAGSGPSGTWTAYGGVPIVGTCPFIPVGPSNVNRFVWMRAGTGRFWGNVAQPINSNGFWGGTRDSWVFIDEPLTRSGSGNGGVCETQAQYPGTRWAGTGSNGTAHPSGVVVSPSPVDPVFVWNNSGGGAIAWSTSDQSGATQTCFNGPTSNVFLLNRDIFLAAPSVISGTVSAIYTPFQNPHPLNATNTSSSIEETAFGNINPKFTSFSSRRIQRISITGNKF